MSAGADNAAAVVKIREGEAADAATLAELGRATGIAYFSHIWSPAELKRFLSRDFAEEVLCQHLAEPDRYTYTLLEHAGKPVGFTRINWKRPVPLSDAVGAELQKIYFLPAFTGKGLGTRLLEDTIQRIRARREQLLWLDVLSNNPRARKLYERHGFTLTGILPFDTGLVELNRHIMVRREVPGT